MDELGIVQVHCDRCGAPLRALTGTLLLSAEVRESLGRWCDQCVTPAEQEQLSKAVLDAVLELAR
jgi:Protein of unknown function (DUF2688).